MVFDPKLGPLGALVGVWEGESGNDHSPSDKSTNNRELVVSKYREQMIFEPTGGVDNHEQQLYGLRYSTKAWRIGSPDPFHEELGYWMWDAASKLVIRTFMPPRGLTILAGGQVEPDAREISLEANSGAEDFGICSSPFLLKEFKTVKYTLNVKIENDDTFSYDQHTWLKMKSSADLFDHADQNTLARIK